MRLIPAAILALCALPASALELTHSYGGRFGVSYASNPGAGLDSTRPLGEAWLALGLRHRTDNGLTIAFEMEVVASDLPENRPRHPGRISVGIGHE